VAKRKSRKSPVRKKKVVKNKIPLKSTEEIFKEDLPTLTFPEELVDNVSLRAIAWRDQKNITALGDDNRVYIYNHTSKKWNAYTETFEVQ
jgi:hypothetical protein